MEILSDSFFKILNLSYLVFSAKIVSRRVIRPFRNFLDTLYSHIV